MINEVLHIFTDGEKAVTVEVGGRWDATIEPLRPRVTRWSRLVWPVNHGSHRVALHCPIGALELSWR